MTVIERDQLKYRLSSCPYSHCYSLLFCRLYILLKNPGVFLQICAIKVDNTVSLYTVLQHVVLYTHSVKPYYSAEHWTHITAQARSGSQGIKSPCSSAALTRTHTHTHTHTHRTNTHCIPLLSPHHIPSVLQKLGYEIHQGLTGQPPQSWQTHVNQPADNADVSTNTMG